MASERFVGSNVATSAGAYTWASNDHAGNSEPKHCVSPKRPAMEEANLILAFALSDKRASIA